MLGEFDLIARYLRPLAAAEPGALGLTDDAAVLAPPPGEDLVIAADAMVAGVHFLAEDPADTVGRKLLRVNLSDLAAMGARPLGYLTTLALPKAGPDGADTEPWLAGFTAGLARDQAEFGLGLLGGDMTRTEGPLTASLTILGAVPAGCRLLRSTAKAGEAVYVSGSIGDGTLGLALLQGRLALDDAAARDFLTERYRLPVPRLALGRALLAEGLASAAIDVSDGLAADAGHIAETSGCRLEIEAARVPRSPAAEAALAVAPDLAEALLTGGDDYELLFTAPAGAEAGLEALAARLDLPLTRIGRTVAGEGVALLDGAGRPLALERGGWRHF